MALFTTNCPPKMIPAIPTIINKTSLGLNFFSSTILADLRASPNKAYRYIPKKHSKIRSFVLVSTPSVPPVVKKLKLNMNRTILEKIA